MTRSGGGSRADRRWGRARPERAFGTASGAIILLVVWAAVAHASGSGWVQALAALAGGIVLVGLLAPLWAVRRVTVDVVEAPGDATAGQSLEISVAATRSCRCSPIRPKGPPVLLRAGQPTQLTLQPEQRGVLGAINVRIASAAPLGLLWWSSRRRLELPRLVLIAPALGEARGSFLVSEMGESGKGQAKLADQGELRGARPYRSGDSPRLVHWRATAHIGSLMVRESEIHPDRPVHVIAVLPDDAELAELEASEVRSTVAGLLEHRRRVVLETTEDGDRIAAIVP
ncbi:MAG: DUF58 domain-containing protein, partial [Acidimicrobiales bacterium]